MGKTRAGSLDKPPAEVIPLGEGRAVNHKIQAPEFTCHCLMQCGDLFVTGQVTRLENRIFAAGQRGGQLADIFFLALAQKSQRQPRSLPRQALSASPAQRPLVADAVDDALLAV